MGVVEDTQPTVLVVNGLRDTIDMLRLVIEAAGFPVAEMQARDLRMGDADLADVVTACGAKVVLFDVAIPYEENWRTVQACLHDPALAGTNFVLTTTNQRALEALVGKTDTLEIIGKPYDLSVIVDAVRRAAAAPGGRIPDSSSRT